MAPYSSTLAWKIPSMEEPGGLQSMGSQRVGHDWATSLSLSTFHFHALEKEMATHSIVLAWRIPGTAESGGLPSMGSHRVRHDWSDLVAAAEAEKLTAANPGSVLTFWDGPHAVEGVSLWINLLLTYHFVCHWVLSVVRHQQFELHEVLRPGVWSQLTDHWFKSQSGFWLGSSPHNHVSQVLLTINLSVYILPSFQHTHILLHLFFWGVLKQVVKLPTCAQSQTAMEVVLKPHNSGWNLEESGTQREQTSNSVHVLCKTLQDSNFHQRRSQRH